MFLNYSIIIAEAFKGPKKNVSINKWVEQGCRIQVKYSKINCWILAIKKENWNFKNSISNSIKQYKINRINLTNDVENLYTTSLGENFKNLNKWKDKSCLWIRRLLVLPKLIYRFITILFKILAGLFVNLGKLILNFTWWFKGPIFVKTTKIWNK